MKFYFTSSLSHFLFQFFPLYTHSYSPTDRNYLSACHVLSLPHILRYSLSLNYTHSPTLTLLLSSLLSLSHAVTLSLSQTSHILQIYLLQLLLYLLYTFQTCCVALSLFANVSNLLSHSPFKTSSLFHSLTHSRSPSVNVFSFFPYLSVMW